MASNSAGFDVSGPGRTIAVMMSSAPEVMLRRWPEEH
jgi:hypothetical protein